MGPRRHWDASAASTKDTRPTSIASNAHPTPDPTSSLPWARVKGSRSSRSDRLRGAAVVVMPGQGRGQQPYGLLARRYPVERVRSEAPATGLTMTSSTAYRSASSRIAAAAASGRADHPPRPHLLGQRPVGAVEGVRAASSTVSVGRSSPPVRSATMASSWGRTRRSASSWVSATTTFTVRKVVGAPSVLRGRNPDR